MAPAPPLRWNAGVPSRALLLSLLIPACAGAPPGAAWNQDLLGELAAARREGREVAVFFALPGRDASDRMERAALPDPVVRAALAEGGFRSARADGFQHQRLFAQWIGGQEGMGLAVADARGEVVAARPGPQDAPELAAFLRLATRLRPERQAAEAALAAQPGAEAEHRLGTVLLELGCRQRALGHLVTAAMAGRHEAAGQLALLHGQDGRLQEARRWLQLAPATPGRQVTDGYLAFKERRHQHAVDALHAALQHELPAGERQRARLFLGKALHEVGRSGEALALLRGLVAEATGSTFEGAALHTIAHIESPDHGHSH